MQKLGIAKNVGFYADPPFAQTHDISMDVGEFCRIVLWGKLNTPLAELLETELGQQPGLGNTVRLLDIAGQVMTIHRDSGSGFVSCSLYNYD